MSQLGLFPSSPAGVRCERQVVSRTIGVCRAAWCCLALSVAHVAVAAEPAPTPEFAPEAIEFFEKEVRPLLAAHCYECHSRDAKTLRGGLLLDSRADVLKGGDTGPAIEPGKPKKSLLIDAVSYGETYQMPPKKRLDPKQVAALSKWVELGAPWPREAAKADPKKFDLAARKAGYWCWQPLHRSPPPTVRGADWPRQTLDRFILASLEEKGLAPAAPADRRALLRRAYFDLIGLPPSAEELQAFLADQSPKAFEKVVDRLLDSPHFGERWARHWMDQVRYAETYGHEFDYPIPHASAYRDYLIRAFNADVPYDQFVVEHLAGDLLSAPRRHPRTGANESIVATGFWWFGEATHAPVDVGADACGRVDNQIDVLTKTFLGVTVACARCHDHKFDAISTKDYYALSGFLKSSRRQEAPLDPDGKIRQAASALAELQQSVGAALASAVPSVAADSIAKQLTAAYEAISTKAGDLDVVALKHGLQVEQLAPWTAALADPALNEPAHPLHVWRLATQDERFPKDGFARLKTRLEDARQKNAAALASSTLFADFEGGTYDGWFTTGEAFGERPTTTGEWNAASSSVRPLRPGVAHSGRTTGKLHGVLRSPSFTIGHKNILYRLAGDKALVRVVIDGYFMHAYSGLLFGGTHMKVDGKPDFVWIAQGGDLGRYIGHRAHLEIVDQGDGFAAVDEIRFSDQGPPPPGANPLALAILGDGPIASPEALAAATAKTLAEVAARWRSGKADAHDVELIEWALRHRLLSDAKTAAALQRQVEEASRRGEQIVAALPAPRYVLAMCDGDGWNDRVHVRGSHRKLGEEAPRGILEALGMPGLPADERGSGRLQLARQFVAPTNPLTSRVMVNRVWHHLFGRGIVGSVDNFGVLGQTPTHPELLDHLAAMFQAPADDGSQSAPRTGVESGSQTGASSGAGWSIKRLIRTLMLSATYQMSSEPTPKGDEVDPQNLLLHRANIRRLEGEVIRDAILKLSGRLDPTVYGPSVAVHLTPFMQGRGRPGGGPLDGAGRRSLYTEVRRNFLPPMMLAFDAPIPFSSVGARNVSNVPAQALILMNDPFVVQQSEVWAKRLLSRKERTVEQRIATLYEDAYSRPPTDDETAAAQEFLRVQAEELAVPADQMATHEKLWADLCHVLLNVKEFIYVR